MCRRPAQRIKAECEFAAFKWDDLIPGPIDKKFDIIMSSMEVTSERRKRMGLLAPLLSPGAFIAAKGAPFDGPPFLLRATSGIGIQKDSTHADWADKSFRHSAQLKRYNTIAEALEELPSERGRRGVRRQGAALAVGPEA